MARTIAGLARHLPSELVPLEALARLEEACAWLPAALSNWIYLECRLAGPGDQTDLIIGVEAEGRDILAGRNPALRLPPAMAAEPCWARVAALCRRWADPRSPLHHGLSFLWLEFDLDAGPSGGGPPPPGVFAGLRPHVASGPRLAEVTAQVLGPLLNGPVPPATAAAMARCLGALPAGASVPYVGVLLPREGAGVRLCLAGLGEAELPDYVAAVGWPGSPARLRGQLAAVAGTRAGALVPGPALVHLDVGAGVGPRLGLEYVSARAEQLRGAIQEQAFLDALAHGRLSTPERRAALERWPGCRREARPHELWPTVARRWVNHVKLVATPDGAVHAKAYLTVSHGMFRGAAAAGRTPALPDGAGAPTWTESAPAPEIQVLAGQRLT